MEDKKPDISKLPRAAIGMQGLPVSRNTRLPSIRSPRDLTLGSQPKRTFTPNIPVRRVKREPVEEPTHSEDSGRAETKPQEQKYEKSRGRGKNRANIIQTEGSVFGEGFAASGSKAARARNRDYERVSVPRASKKEPQGPSKENIKSVLKSLLKDDFIDYGDDEEEVIKPIVLPLKPLVKEEIKKQEEESEVEETIEEITKMIKKEIKIKDEPEAKYPLNLLPSGEPKFMMFKLPDLYVRSDDSEKDPRQKEPKPDGNANGKGDGGSLSALPEGRIGKLQVLRSGKLRLLLNDLVLENDEQLIPVAVKSHIMSVKTQEKEGEISMLGDLHYKAKFVPNVEHVLSNH